MVQGGGLAYLKVTINIVCRYSYDGNTPLGAHQWLETDANPKIENLYLTTPCPAVSDHLAYIVFALMSRLNAEKNLAALRFDVDFVRRSH